MFLFISTVNSQSPIEEFVMYIILSFSKYLVRFRLYLVNDNSEVKLRPFDERCHPRNYPWMSSHARGLRRIMKFIWCGVPFQGLAVVTCYAYFRSRLKRIIPCEFLAVISRIHAELFTGYRVERKWTLCQTDWLTWLHYGPHKRFGWRATCVRAYFIGQLFV